MRAENANRDTAPLAKHAMKRLRSARSPEPVAIMKASTMPTAGNANEARNKPSSTSRGTPSCGGERSAVFVSARLASLSTVAFERVWFASNRITLPITEPEPTTHPFRKPCKSGFGAWVCYRVFRVLVLGDWNQGWVKSIDFKVVGKSIRDRKHVVGRVFVKRSRIRPGVVLGWNRHIVQSLGAYFFE